MSVRTLGIVTLLAFFSMNCDTPLEVHQSLLGVWELEYTANSSDSVYLGTVLRLDNSSFSCSYGFFFYDDSIKKSKPLKGSWKNQQETVLLPDRQSFLGTINTITFYIDTLQKVYLFSRSPNDSLLYFYCSYHDDVYYRWKRLNR